MPPASADPAPPAAPLYPARRIVWLALLTAAVASIVCCAHSPGLSARARGFDDGEYLLKNRLVQNPSWNSVGRFFGEVLAPSSVGGYYQPLAMTSLMLDVAAGGGPHNLAPFHRTSLILHAANTALVILLLTWLGAPPLIAAGVGLAFGVHPLTVEPVPWLSERKTLLATLFALACLCAYVRYAHTRRRWTYALVVATLILALLSKPTTLPLPLLLVILDWWPLRRLGRRALVEKLPLFAIAALSAVITYISQAHTSVVINPDHFPVSRGAWLLAHNTILYLQKLVWPTDLTPFYPFPEPFDWSCPAVRAGVIGCTIVAIVLAASLRWTRAAVAGFAFFWITLLPVMGVVQYTSVVAADKYAYLPMVGLLIALAAGLTKLWDSARARPVLIRTGVVLGLLAIVALEVPRTRAQASLWRDTQTLYEHMLRHAPRAWQLHAMLANEYLNLGRTADARQHWTIAAELNPRDAETQNNLGRLLADEGRWADARPYFERAVALDPRFPIGHVNLGRTLVALGRFDEARPLYDRALVLDPNSPDAHYALGVLHARQERYDQALPCFLRTLELDDRYVNAYVSLGQMYLRQQRPDLARDVLARGLRIAPDNPRLRADFAKLGPGVP